MTVLFDNLRAESAWWGSRIKRLQSFLGAFELMQDRLLSSRTTGNCWKSAHAGNGRGSHTVHIACTLDTFIRTHSGSSSLCTACHVSCFPHNAHSAGEVGFGGHICRCRCRVSLPNERPGMMPPCERTVLGLQRISHTIPPVAPGCDPTRSDASSKTTSMVPSSYDNGGRVGGGATATAWCPRGNWNELGYDAHPCARRIVVRERCRIQSSSSLLSLFM